jgi:GT2 family glycosyltransferase
MTEASEARRPPEVSVLIVNFRSTGLLRGCLRSLRASTIADRLEVIVVDNASPDFDAAAMGSEFPEVTFLPQDHNTTFTGGTNIAFAMATGRFILMLNPDTRLEPDALARAVMRLEEEPQLAGVTARLQEESGELQRYYRRLPRLVDVPAVLMARLFDRTVIGRRYLMADETFESSTLVEQPAGAFIFMRRSVCPEPLLDPGYFNLFSDVELCRRVRAHGAIRMEPDIRCFHVRGGAGLGTKEPEGRSLIHQDYVWGVRRYYRGAGGIAGKVWVETWIGVFWALRLAQALTRDGRHRRATWKAIGRSFRGLPPDYATETG